MHIPPLTDYKHEAIIQPPLTNLNVLDIKTLSTPPPGKHSVYTPLSGAPGSEGSWEYKLEAYLWIRNSKNKFLSNFYQQRDIHIYYV